MTLYGNIVNVILPYGQITICRDVKTTGGSSCVNQTICSSPPTLLNDPGDHFSPHAKEPIRNINSRMGSDKFSTNVNATMHDITVRYSTTSFGEVEIYVIDMLGKKVLTTRGTLGDEQVVHLSSASLVPGIYTIVKKQDNKQSVQRLIINNN